MQMTARCLIKSRFTLLVLFAHSELLLSRSRQCAPCWITIRRCHRVQYIHCRANLETLWAVSRYDDGKLFIFSIKMFRFTFSWYVVFLFKLILRQYLLRLRKIYGDKPVLPSSWIEIFELRSLVSNGGYLTPSHRVPNQSWRSRTFLRLMEVCNTWWVSTAILSKEDLEWKKGRWKGKKGN